MYGHRICVSFDQNGIRELTNHAGHFLGDIHLPRELRIKRHQLHTIRRLQNMQLVSLLHAQLLQKLLVLLVLGNAHHEGNEADAVPNRLFRAPDDGLVVGRQPELELRFELEPLCAHEPRGDGVTPCYVLDERLREALSLLRLGGRHEPRAFESSDLFLGFAAVPIGDKQRSRRVLRVVS